MRAIVDQTPLYSRPLGYLVPDAEDDGVSRGLSYAAGFKDAGGFNSALHRDSSTWGDIRLSSVLPGD